MISQQPLQPQGATVSRRLFTSESVTEGHPDKIADQISDAILDALLARGPARRRVAVETLITTGQVHVAGEVTTKAYADIAQLVRETILEIGYDSSKKGFDGASCGVSVSIGAQSPDIAQGVDNAYEHRVEGDERRARPAGRRRPGPDVRLRLRRDARADAAADHAGAPARPAAVRGPQGRHRPVPAPRRQDPGHHRVRRRHGRSASTPSSSPPSTPPTSPWSRCSTPDVREHVIEPCSSSPTTASSSTPRATGCWSTRPAASRSAARWATPASPAARSSSTPTAAWPATAAAPSPARTRPRSTARPRTRCAGSPRTSSPPASPRAARSRSPTRSARPSPVGLFVETFGTETVAGRADREGHHRGLRPAPGRDHPRPRPAAPDLRADRGVRPLRPRAARLHLGAHRPRRRAAQGRRRGL